MMKRLVRYQLIAFVLVTVIGITYASIEYAQLPRLLGLDRYDVGLALPDSGGLYPNALVTYRGTEVGNVTDIGLTDTGVHADLRLNDDVGIPADLTAEVRSTSAIGEQYIELLPRTTTGPVLANGDQIPASRVALPTTTAQLLGTVNGLVRSIPGDKLNTTIDEAYNAFNGTGPSLQRLFDSLRLLQQSADQNLDPTVRLFQDLQPVLATQIRRGGDITSSLSDLASFTDQLKMSDPDIRAAIDAGPGFADELDKQLNQLRPTLPALLNNLTNVAQVTSTYTDAIYQTVIILPAPTNALQSVANRSPIPGAALLNFRLNINDPPPCTAGYLDPAQRRDPNDVTPVPAVPNASCKEPPTSPIGVRTNRNSPCPPDSPRPDARGADAADCGLIFQNLDEAAAQRQRNLDYEVQVAQQAPKTRAERVQDDIAHGVTPTDPLRGTGGAYVGQDPGPTTDPLAQDSASSSSSSLFSMGSGSSAPDSGSSDSGVKTTAYAPETGLFIAPDGKPMVNGNALPSPPGLPPGLGTFLLGPLSAPA